MTREGNVAAIDFGTTFCSLAFSVKRGKTICIPLNPNRERVPTAILLKKEGGNSISISGIGFVAQEMYEHLPSRECADHLYFECFKMQLRNEEDITREKHIFAFVRQSYYLIEVISLVLYHMKTEFEKYLTTSIYQVKVTDFNWVITVPAIWKNRGKQMMREAAHRAGLLSTDVLPITTLTPVDQPLKQPDMRHCANNLTLALEPECAALYCQQMTSDMLADYCDPVHGVTSKCYMVLDIGGGTTDIAIHKVENTIIKSVIPPTGNEWGGTRVNQKFSEVLQDIVRDPEFEKFCTTRNREAIHKAIISLLIFHDFEQQKNLFGNDANKEFVNIRLNHRFVSFYEEENIATGVEALNDDRISFDDDVLIIHVSKMEELFAHVVKEIVECINTTCTLIKSDVPIDTAYLVGGFGGCQYLYRKVKEALVKRYPRIRVIVPKDHKLAVVMGAVIYQQNPGIVGSRVSDAYYGIETTETFDQETHELCRKTWNDELKLNDCYDVFDTFINKGQVVKFDDTHTGSYVPLSASQTTTSFPIYKTTKDRVQYTKDSRGNPIPGVELIGQLTVETPACDLPRERRDIKCTLHLGGTELKVTAFYVPNRKEVHAAFDFLS